MAHIRFNLIIITFLLSSAGYAHAFCDDTDSFLDKACQRVTDTWTQGDSDLYIPFHTYHLRFNYTQEKLDSYRENAWGIGYGRSHYDESGNLDSLYGMTFLDSHSKLQYVAGYSHQWMWGQQQDWHAGLGYAAFLTARSNYVHYVPIPGIVPVASVNYDKLSINAAYIPGFTKNNGNVMLFWSTVGF